MELKLFGVAKDIIGSNKLSITAEDFATVGELKQWLSQQYPKLQQLRSVAVAVNSEYAEDNQSLQNAYEIALIPPVSGG
ncbi:molybdopterin converting factor subunit 1 [Ilyomonas limi]|uniref:Molybdopterin synthase sulfur carrier subunit n=1 Tax=Ilyomonas limi TaxID=2575867 RepID=A0A4U3L8R8_9BACT|nr:molybdopterin converting factor subunit 1 [Ilyomonas limi]TKK71668.1 molybdopterin converting factor subunit 1 [Ilyomonas limi]